MLFKWWLKKSLFAAFDSIVHSGLASALIWFLAIVLLRVEFSFLDCWRLTFIILSVIRLVPILAGFLVAANLVRWYAKKTGVESYYVALAVTKYNFLSYWKTARGWDGQKFEEWLERVSGIPLTWRPSSESVPKAAVGKVVVQ